MHSCAYCDLAQPEHLMYWQFGRWFCKAVMECKRRKEGH